MDRKEFKAGSPWKCPACSGQFQFSRTHARIGGLIALAASMVSLYALGLRGWPLLVGGFVMWFPAALIVVVPLSWIIRPSLEPYYRGEERHFTTMFPDETDDSKRN
jgi:hypothetical protein